MFGFHNVVARVNVTQKSFALKVISDELLRRTLGGKGLATQLLLSYTSPNVDALDPENHLVMATGPVTGTALPGSCQHGTFTKSPHTGLYAECYAGNNVAECIAGTGFDALIIHGASEEPIWLEASEQTIMFHGADDLWGLSEGETENRIDEWMKEHRPAAKMCGVVAIGPEVENPLTVSVVRKDDWRLRGGTGIDAVMGSKKIKAVAFWGNRQKELANPRLIQELATDLSHRATHHANVPANAREHARRRGAGAGLEPAPKELSKMVGSDGIQSKAEMFAELEDRLTILDSLILCRSHLDLYQWEELAAMIQGITGLDLALEDMRSIAGGITDNTRRFNLCAGLAPEEDRFPEISCVDALSQTRGAFSERQMKRLLSDYYRARGWDERGMPT